ncbi:MAG TPA: type II CAAX endopeptidase family protein [Tepidisphaeraceae bacterium]|jgi:membrane protease YdiL (CAAX protease family)
MDSDQIPPNVRSHRDLWFETSVVLLLGVIPHLFNAIATFYIESGPRQSFVYQSLFTIVRSAGIIALVLFIISRSGESPSVFGLKPLRKFKDSAQGFGIFVLGMVLYYFIWYRAEALLGHQTTYRFLHSDVSHIAIPTRRDSISLVAIASIANGLAEELVCRAYLITRFEKLFNSTAKAWVLSSLLFGSYHIYQGLGGFISITVIGLLYGGIFCRTRRIWPIAIAHAIEDFVATVMRM